MPLPKPPTHPATILNLTPEIQARSTARKAPRTAPLADPVAPSKTRAAAPQGALLDLAAVATKPAKPGKPIEAVKAVKEVKEVKTVKRKADANLNGSTIALPSSVGEAEVAVEGKLSRATRVGKTAASRAGACAEPAIRKLFVLDTNVLLHDPTSLFRFEEHDIYLPMMTLEELDHHKKGMSEVARNARQVSRSLDALVANADDLEVGAELSAQGHKEARGRLLFQTSAIDSALPDALPMGKADNQILGVVRALHELYPSRTVVLVSKDINMRLKARALGLAAEDYYNDQVLEDADLLYTGILPLPENFWNRHGKDIESWQQEGITYYRVTGPLCAKFMVNQFVYFEGPMPLYAQVREVSGKTAVLATLRDHTHGKNNIWGITARNREQNFALNLLLNPECDFVTLLGQAGTGKTLLALAAGLAQVLDTKRYSEIIMTRATVSVGEDIGFLPGTEEEKMQPWMGALEDNLEVLNTRDASQQGNDWTHSAAMELIRSRIKIKAMNFMRGRTFLNKFLIIDEAQNLTPKQMKTLVTRAGPGTKVICLGNIAQIDTPYLTEGSSGLTYVVDRFKGWPHCGHVTLQRGERSRLADYAAEVL